MTNEERKDAERVQLEQAAARAVNLDALPKALSAEEREELEAFFQSRNPRVLTLIDALTAALAEAVARMTVAERDEADQAVLDAMAMLPEVWLRAWSVCRLANIQDLAKAELARRGLK